MDVDRWLDTITAKQFDEWVAYAQLEPNRDDRLLEALTRGLVCLCNSWGSNLKMSDLDPYYEEQKEQAVELTPQQMFDRMKAYYGGV